MSYILSTLPTYNGKIPMGKKIGTLAEFDLAPFYSFFSNLVSLSDLFLLMVVPRP